MDGGRVDFIRWNLMDEGGEDIRRWMEEGKTLGDGWRRGRHYEMDGGEEDITRWMEEGKTLGDGWRRGRLYETDGGLGATPPTS